MVLKTTEKVRRKAGFTLVELLVVIAIGAIIATLSVSSYSRVIGSGLLTTATQSVLGLLEQARQTAIANNTYVEVRLYELPPANSLSTAVPSVFRAMQSFIVTDTGYTPLSKILYLPTPLAIQYSSTIGHSTLLDSTQDTTATGTASILTLRTPSSWGTVTPAVTTAPSLPVYTTNYQVITFRFSPKGSLASLDDSKQWFFTFFSLNDSVNATTHLPTNYTVIQIDGFTGKATYYRP